MTVPSLDADDATVIERSWHEPERFAELYDRHAAAIHRYVSRRLGDETARNPLTASGSITSPCPPGTAGSPEGRTRSGSPSTARAAPTTAPRTREHQSSSS